MNLQPAMANISPRLTAFLHLLIPLFYFGIFDIFFNRARFDVLRWYREMMDTDRLRNDGGSGRFHSYSFGRILAAWSMVHRTVPL